MSDETTADLQKRIERVLLQTLGRSHHRVAEAIVQNIFADVPVPAPGVLSGVGKYVDATRRIAEFEAKLAKVLEWQRSETIEASAFDRLYAILNDKETP